MFFFSIINLVKDFQDIFSAFESQDNIQIAYIWFNMLMFLKKPVKNIFKTHEIIVFEIFSFSFFI